mmetsp:Transcript_11300/g.28961  ORF Transcript_11300/g.28961 Transcript_11300/m.28961 type:complete len:312 (-) Transcript_11300:415-1350(-)|eukprot:jgi/Tetstr1/426598/TSEL_016876.t1
MAATAGWVSLEEAQKRVLGTPIIERTPEYFAGLFKALKELLPDEFPTERCHTYRSLPRLLSAGTGVKIAPNVSRDDGLAFAREAMAGPYAPPEQVLQMTKSGRYICAVYLSARFGQLITPRMVRDLCFEQPSNSIQIAPFLRNLLAPYPNLLQKPLDGEPAGPQQPTFNQNVEQFSGTLVSSSLKGLFEKMDSLVEWLETEGAGGAMDTDPDFQADAAPMPSYAWHSQYLPPQPPVADWSQGSQSGAGPPPPMLMNENFTANMPAGLGAPPAPAFSGMSVDQAMSMQHQQTQPGVTTGGMRDMMVHLSWEW